MGYQGAEGYNDTQPESRGFAVANMLGYRSWRLRRVCDFSEEWVQSHPAWRAPSRAGQLHSPSQPFDWTEGDQLARCCEPDSHPTRDCSHGFYATFEPKRFGFLNDQTTGILIDGLMQGWGYCVVGDLGFRSQFGRIIALHMPDLNTHNSMKSWWNLQEGHDDADWPRAYEAIWSALEKFYPTVPIYASARAMLDDYQLEGRPR